MCFCEQEEEEEEEEQDSDEAPSDQGEVRQVTETQNSLGSRVEGLEFRVLDLVFRKFRRDDKPSD